MASPWVRAVAPAAGREPVKDYLPKPASTRQAEEGRTPTGTSGSTAIIDALIAYLETLVS